MRNPPRYSQVERHKIKISWDPVPEQDSGGLGILHYDLLWNHGEKHEKAEFVLVTTLYTSLSVTNVDPAKHYRFAIRSSNHCGYSKPSPELIITPDGSISSSSDDDRPTHHLVEEPVRRPPLLTPAKNQIMPIETTA